MAFDGGLPRRDRRAVATKRRPNSTLVDIVAADLEEPRAPRRPVPLQVDLPLEPEELRLWRHVAAHRERLVNVLVRWEEFRDAQRRGWRKSADQAAKAGRQVNAEARAYAEAFQTRQIGLIRLRLDQVDGAIRDLRSGSRKGVYTLVGLRKLVKALTDPLRSATLAALKAYLKEPDDERAFMFKLAVELERSGDELAIDAAAEAARESDLDLGEIVAKANKERFAQGLSGTHLPGLVLAHVLGTKPFERKNLR